MNFYCAVFEGFPTCVTLFYTYHLHCVVYDMFLSFEALSLTLFFLQVTHDCRLISDYLFHRHNIKLINVFDTQVIAR